MSASPSTIGHDTAAAPLADSGPRQSRVWRRLAGLWLVPDSAENLALFRIVIALLLLGSGDLAVAPQVAALPPALRIAPDGAAWLALLPLAVPAVKFGVALVYAAALFALIGFHARLALAVATLAGLYTLGVAQLGGAVFHCHHLLWCSALLGASPCSDALSVDAWWMARRHPGQAPAPAVCYGLPLRIAWTLFGVVFFFPGLWKLRTSGWAWIVSDNLQNQMYVKWLQMGGYLPSLRIDKVPLLCHAIAAFVVLLELSFPLLVFLSALRKLAVLCALLFHLGAWLYMGIDYSNLWPCYVIFFDWTAVLGWLRARLPGPRKPLAYRLPSHALLPTLLLGCGLLFGSVLQGARGRMSAWPFACYPTFARLAPASLPLLLVDVSGPDGNPRVLPRPSELGRHSGPRAWALNWSALGIAAGASGRAPDPRRMQAYWDYLRTLPELAPTLTSVCIVRFYRATMAVQPEASRTSQAQHKLLYTLSLPCTSTGS